MANCNIEKGRSLLRIIFTLLSMKKALLILLSITLFPFFYSCNWHKDRLKVDLSQLKIPQISINRYDEDLFKIPVSDLKKGLFSIQPKYLFFLGTDLNDTLKLAEIKTYLENPRTNDFHQAVHEKFLTLTSEEERLSDAFRHINYYYPSARLPHLYGYISGGDYENPVRLVDSIMIIALDCYLGSNFKPYLSDGVSQYKIHRMTPEYIVPDCIATMVNEICPVNSSAVTLLDQMVDAGKRLYLADAFQPSAPDSLKIGYSTGQYDWITKNESHVWAAIIDNSMLYTSMSEYARVFFSDGPFTASFGKESPPRLGEWIGWRIVKAYMDNNTKVTLQNLVMERDSQKILTLSGYKPEK